MFGAEEESARIFIMGSTLVLSGVLVVSPAAGIGAAAAGSASTFFVRRGIAFPLI